MQRCDFINLGAEIEYQGLRGRRLLSFSPLTRPRDFLPSPKQKPAPAIQASVWAAAGVFIFGKFGWVFSNITTIIF